MKDKVAVITGGSSGIGKALAEVLGREGAKVVITGRKMESLEDSTKYLEAKNIEVLALQGDVSKEEDCKKLVEDTIEKFGRIDVLVNNAGISMHALFEDCEIEVIRKVMEINFFGMVYTTKYALPYILKAKGTIIGVSSIAGYRGLPVRIGYSASKFAMNGFLEALRTELLYKGVNVMTVAPGFTESNIRKVALSKDGESLGESFRNEQKMMTSEEVAERILKAIRKRKRSLVLTRQGKLTVFMNKWLPKMMDKMVFKTLAKEKDSPLKKEG